MLYFRRKLIMAGLNSTFYTK